MRPTDPRLTALRRHWRAATRRHRDPWTTTSGGLQLHTGGGMWGQVVLRDPRVHPDHVTLGIFAGSLHPYLMQVVNKLDPAKPPPPAFVAANGLAVWDLAVGFAGDAASGPPAPYDDTRPADPDWWHHPILTEATAEAWLADALTRIVPATEVLCTEDGLLAHLGRSSSSFQLRSAGLLARHLGRDAELAALLAAAERAWLAEQERLREMGLPPVDQDRQTTYPQSWSHRRFLRFLDETAP